jgi:hypothetical protein
MTTKKWASSARRPLDRQPKPSSGKRPGRKGHALPPRLTILDLALTRAVLRNGEGVGLGEIQP